MNILREIMKIRENQFSMPGVYLTSSNTTSKMKVIHLLVSMIFLFDKNFISGQKYEGDNCVDRRYNENGICTLISKCERAKSDIKKNIYPTTCGFIGNEILVCCRKELNQVKVREPGEISNKMCVNYAQYVWTTKPSPLLIPGAQDIHTRECPFDRLNLVVGGDPATKKEFPHMAQIGYDADPIKWACGGSLISDRFVLTASHCLDDRSYGLALYVRMGLIDIDDLEQSEQYNIIDRIFHPQYNDYSNYHDIGLARLDRKVQMNTYIRPACLYTKRSSPWSKVIATGWGATSYGGDSSVILLKVVLELYDENYCTKVYKRESNTTKLSQGIKDDIMICAGHSQELKDTCQGDSGGPLQVYRDTTNKNMTCMYDIIGVTSFGKGCGLAVNIPGVYTRVSNYLKWLEDIVWPIE